MTIGENIKSIRKKKGITQKELAKRTGLNEVTIRSYEAGKYKPKIETVDKIAKALGVYIVDIMNDYTFEEYQTTSEYQDDLKYSAAEQGLLSILSDIYESVDKKMLEVKPHVYVCYFVITTKEKQKFILHYRDIIPLMEYLEGTLPFLVNMVKDTKPEEQIIDSYMKDDLQ